MPNVIERVAVQAAGAFGAIRASVRGLNGVFSRLSEEHRENVVLLEQALAAEEKDDGALLWVNARNELLAHEHAEREHVYPQLAGYSELQKFGSDHDAQLGQLELLIAEIDALVLGSKPWRAAVERLEQHVRLHADNEEQQFFPVAQAAIGVGRSTEIEGLYINGRRSILHELKLPTDDDPADGR